MTVWADETFGDAFLDEAGNRTACPLTRVRVTVHTPQLSPKQTPE